MFFIHALFTLTLATPVHQTNGSPVHALSKRGNELEERQISSRNDLIMINDRSQCSNSIIIIWARGTTEAGNVGVTIGPLFFSAVSRRAPGRVLVQGVNDYPANNEEFFEGGSRSGGRYMASMVSMAETKCPDAKVVLAGYSQGAQVIHLAAGNILLDLYPKVAAIILFGDPKNGEAFPGTLNDVVKSFCEITDPICYGIPILALPHYVYVAKVDEGADYAVARA